jgi:hypothetical protein
LIRVDPGVVGGSAWTDSEGITRREPDDRPGRQAPGPRSDRPVCCQRGAVSWSCLEAETGFLSVACEIPAPYGIGAGILRTRSQANRVPKMTRMSQQTIDKRHCRMRGSPHKLGEAHLTEALSAVHCTWALAGQAARAVPLHVWHEPVQAHGVTEMTIIHQRNEE